MSDSPEVFDQPSSPAGALSGERLVHGFVGVRRTSAEPQLMQISGSVLNESTRVLRAWPNAPSQRAARFAGQRLK